jgi:hypothetical protein
MAAWETMSGFGPGGVKAAYSPNERGGLKFLELAAAGKNGAILR